MKLKTLLVSAVALLCTAASWAQASYNLSYTEGVTVETGSDFFLYNIGSGTFLTGGMDWGARASGDHGGKTVILAAHSDNDGGYSIKLKYYDGDGDSQMEGYLTKGESYTDETKAPIENWKFESILVDGYTNAYLIKASDDTYLQYNNADTRIKTDVNSNDNYSRWLLIPKSVRDAVGDYTYYLQNVGMNRFWERGWWAGCFWQQNKDGDNWNKYFTTGGNADNPCCERYHATQDFYQAVSTNDGKMPHGKYKLWAQGFYRQDGDAETAPYLYINSAKSDLNVKDGDEQWMTNASTSFSAGKYVNSVETIITNGKLQVGINITGSNQWVIWDNFYLEYLGNAVEVYSPTSFTSNTSATGGTWYSFTITYPGLYKITSSAAATINYTQNESDDADETDNVVLAASGSTTMSLSAGTFYFKSSVNSTIKIEAFETNMTSVINNPSFETGNKTGWNWSSSSGQSNWNDALKSGRLVEGGGNYYLNFWAQETNNKVRQTINLPAGSYKLSAYVQTGSGQTLNLKAGSATTTRTAENGDPFKMEVCFTLASQQNVEISVGSAAAGAWYNMDDFRLTYYDSNENRTKIIINKGDITSLINSDFDTNADGWSNYTSYCVNQTWTNRSWRGDVQSGWIERNSNGTMTCTVPNMPAGDYKVVAAARTYNNGKLKAQVAGGDYGTEITGVGDNRNSNSTTEINTNGVEMPYSSLGGFTTVDVGHNWHWISATGTLASAGPLVINFTCTGSDWMAIDDVHLYCTELDGTSYTYTVDDDHLDAGDKVVTADIILSNPNAIITSDAAINGAAGTQINNNLVGGTIANMVLYDGNSYTSPAGEYAITNATYYRNFTSGRNATVMVPFTLDATTKEAGKAYTPTRYANDVVLFTTVDDPAADVPYVFVPSSDITSLTGARTSASEGSKQVDGTSVTFYGTYATTPITQNANNYVASNNMLWLVDNAQNSNPFRAYLHVDAPANVKSLSIRLDDATGIQAVEGSQSQKTSIYNLAGQRLNKLQKGINIVNGKKVLVK